MPFDPFLKIERSFVDKYARKGRPTRAPEGEVKIDAQPFSRSLIQRNKARSIRCEIKDSTLKMDVSEVIGDKIRIKKKDAIKLANWMLEVFNGHKRSRR